MCKGLSAGREEWLAAPSAILAPGPLHIAPAAKSKEVRAKRQADSHFARCSSLFALTAFRFALTLCTSLLPLTPYPLSLCHFALRPYLVATPRARAIR